MSRKESACEYRHGFTLFPDLPTELRLKIWQHALQVSYKPAIILGKVRDRNKNDGSVTYEIRCRTPAPSLLRTSRESRAEALAHYSLYFGNTTYLNPKFDEVYLNTRNSRELSIFIDTFSQEDIKSLQLLALKLDDWLKCLKFTDHIRAFNLKKLTLLVDDREEDEVFLRPETSRVVRQELKEGLDKETEWKVPKVTIFVIPGLSNSWKKRVRT